MKLTLIEQLEQAADDAISALENGIIFEATEATIQLYKNRTKRLHARIEHYTKLVMQHTDEVGSSYDEGWQDALDLIDAPLD